MVPCDSDLLVDRTMQRRLATTDPSACHIYLADSLHGSLLETVLIHEIGHAMLVSYGLIDAIHSVVVPERWIEAEEWLCNFVGSYGIEIIDVASDLLGYEVRRIK